MKKLLILPISAIMLLSTSCDLLAKITGAFSTYVEAQQEEDETFETFAEKFYSDAEFQLSRVSFPIGEFHSFKERKKVQYTKENWETLQRYKDFYTNEYTPYKKIDDKSYSLLVETDGGAACSLYTFNLKEDGKWYLVEIKNSSLTY